MTAGKRRATNLKAASSIRGVGVGERTGFIAWCWLWKSRLWKIRGIAGIKKWTSFREMALSFGEEWGAGVCIFGSLVGNFATSCFLLGGKKSNKAWGFG